MSVFDIKQHEWSDSIAGIDARAGAVIVIEFKGEWVCFDKQDVIAMAKHFKLAEEDLEGV